MSEPDSDALLMPPPKKARIDPEPNDTLQEDQSNVDYSEDLVESSSEFSLNGSKYEELVNPEEVERLKEFQVLDEIKSNDEDSDEASESSDGKSEGLPEDEIERMLDEDLPDSFKEAPKPKEKPYITRQKVVLEEKGINHFEVLPLDWMMVRHYSGMPVYMHRATRVCTLSKPYLLGKGNTRRHDIPISAIPCLNYRKALEEEARQKEIDRRIAEQIKNGTWQKTNTTATNNIGSNKNVENERPVENNGDAMSDNVQTNNEAPKNNNIQLENSSSTHERTVVNNVELNNYIALLGNKNNVESNTQSKQIDEMKSIPVEQQNGTHHSEEINQASTEVDQVISRCPLIHRQKQQAAEDALVELNSIKQEYEECNGDVNGPIAIRDSDRNIPGNEGNPTEGEIQSRNPEENGTEETPAEENLLSAQPVVLPGGIVMPPPRVETVSTSWKTQQLSYEQVTEYCRKLFHFKTVQIMHFTRWADRRKYTRARKTLQYPALPSGTKLITIPAHNQPQPTAGDQLGGLLGALGGKANRRDWVMNMNGRSYLSVFHEYVRRALQKQPAYEFKQLENAATPYQATVYIGGMQYGVGRGTSKRLAKANAARASIQILIPEMKDDAPAADAEPDFSFFDYVGIEDPRITEFCAATCEPSPHATLRTCLLRNFGTGERHIHTEMKKLEYQKIELTMKVGKHSATVVCKNKKTAKQRASQAILQLLHPHVRSWGSLLRLYGSRSVKSCKEKKLEEQQITLLQDQARRNEPNHAVLDKLRLEMRRLAERDAAVVPIGTLMLSDDLPSHSGSNLDNVDL